MGNSELVGLERDQHLVPLAGREGLSEGPDTACASCKALPPPGGAGGALGHAKGSEDSQRVGLTVKWGTAAGSTHLTPVPPAAIWAMGSQTVPLPAPSREHSPHPKGVWAPPS